MRVVFDSNVLIPVFLAHGCPKDIFEFAIERAEIILSEYILAEVREKLLHKLKFPKAEIDIILSYLRRCALVVAEEKMPVPFSDKKDILILQLTQSRQADFWVTGDKKLLKLGKVGKAAIITTREALHFF